MQRARRCVRHARRGHDAGRRGWDDGDAADDGHGRTGGTAAADVRAGGTTDAAADAARPALTAPPTTERAGPPPPPTTTFCRPRPRRRRSPLRFAGDRRLRRRQRRRGAVARWWTAGIPTSCITTGDNNYQSGGAATIDANIGKYYAPFIGNYRGSYGAGSATNRFWPSPGNHDWVAPNLSRTATTSRCPATSATTTSTSGLVHLFAVDSDRHEPDGITATLDAGHLAGRSGWRRRRRASTSSTSTTRRTPPASTAATPACDGRSRSGGRSRCSSGHDHLYERLQVGGIPYFVDGTGRRRPAGVP